MRIPIFPILIFLISYPAVIADDVVTASGKTYSSASVSKVEADGLVVIHTDGITKIEAADLPEALRLKYFGSVNTAPKESAPGAQKWAFSYARYPFSETFADPVEALAALSAIANPRPRDQFETQQEYESRLPPLPDLQKIIYFEVDHEAEYSYNIENETLTVFGGSAWPKGPYHTYDMAGGITVLFHRSTKSGREYQVSNALGVSADVVERITTHHFLHLSRRLLPLQLLVKGKVSAEEIVASKFTAANNRRIAFPIRLPRDEAKVAAPDLKLVFAVRYVSAKRAALEITHREKPEKITRPSDWTVLSLGADVELLSVLLVNGKTGEAWASLSPVQ